ncbi:MAG TPA: DUF6457 domain-containing protein [Acidimicrobiia bacterium]|nr:DUF6457 domain-containing protein [Acidimicrobiia bacterium]
MTAQEWVAAFAGRLGVPAPDQATFDQLLGIAAEAAHSSERIAAPIATYLVGRAGLDPETALALSRQTATD